ncbi:hypothetical protein [Clostridium beijerinckii]|uniref:hypothetical protein n=1 Tax=Clostridium beijerinckii TaxID=1520 RepID=UPI00055AF7D7|nr:hypothetical protein [Clostridium beijerinckii]
MIKDIPFCFKDRNEEYLTLGKLQEFCKENKLKTSLDKVELVNSIIEFAKVSEDNSIRVCEWVDPTLKEGIKKIIIFKLNNTRRLMNKTEEEWIEIINEKFQVYESIPILNYEHKNKISLCGYKFVLNEDKVSKVELKYTILLKEQKKKDQLPMSVIYPIFIDVYIDEGYIVGRSKSKSSIFKFQIIEVEDKKKDDITESMNCDKLIGEAVNLTIEKIGVSKEDVPTGLHIFKGIIHKIVDETTATPKEIQEKLDEEKECRQNFIKKFLERQKISLLSGDNYKNAVEDLTVLMEKYMSINYNDKHIFTKDRYGYPIQISATDEDSSSVEETSLEDKPLQCTPIFFDNKKIIQKQKKCDNVIMVFKRAPKTYFTNKTFQAIIEVKRGSMHIELRKYVLEEDIENVLSRIIRGHR